MLCQVPLDPVGCNGRVGLGFSRGGVSAHPGSPREGRGLAVCQYRLSSERGRELWKDVMDRRQGEGKGGKRKTEVRGEEKARERNTRDTHSACLMGSCHTRH